MPKTKPKKTFKISKKIIALLVVLLIFIVILIALPSMVKMGMTKALLNKNVDEIFIEQVSLNVFTGQFSINNMVLKKQGSEPLKLKQFYINIELLSLFKQRLAIKKLVIDGAEVSINLLSDNKLNILNIPLNSPSAEPTTAIKDEKQNRWGIGLKEIFLTNSSVNIQTANFNKIVIFNELSIKDFYTWDDKKPTNISFKILIGNGALNTPSKKTSKGSLVGNFDLFPFSDDKKLDGELTFKNFELKNYQHFIPVEYQQTHGIAKGKITLSSSYNSGNILANIQTQLKLDTVSSELNEIKIQIANISLEDETKLQIKNKVVSVWSISDLSVKDLLVNFATIQKQVLNISGQSINWKGKSSFKQSNETDNQLTSLGNLLIQNIVVKDSHQKTLLASLEELQSEINVVSLKEIQLNKLILSNAQAAKRRDDKRAMVKFKALKLSSLNFINNQDLIIDQVTLSGLDLDLNFDTDKKLPQLEAVIAILDRQNINKTSKEKPLKDDLKASKELKFQLNTFRLAGNNHVFITSSAVKPKFHKKLTLQKITIANLNNKKPNQNTTLDILANIDKLNEIKLTGFIQPFNSKINAQINSQIEDLNLHTFSPLIKRYLGYQIQSGDLNFTSTVKIKDDHLVSDNTILLQGFEMKAEEVTDEKESDQAISPI